MKNMYTYKMVEIPHGMWTGKPSENILAVINHHGMRQWRLNSMTTTTKGARAYTILLLEREVASDYYDSHDIQPLPPEYDPEDFV